jgi:hypothetical protein
MVSYTHVILNSPTLREIFASPPPPLALSSPPWAESRIYAIASFGSWLHVDNPTLSRGALSGKVKSSNGSKGQFFGCS